MGLAFYTLSQDYGTLSVKQTLPFNSPLNQKEHTFTMELRDYLSWTGNDLIQTFYRVDLSIINEMGNEVANNIYTPIGNTNNNPNFQITLPSGTYQFNYKIYGTRETGEYAIQTFAYLNVTIVVVENRYRPKLWTVLDVINRVFELIKPLKYGQKPLFRLQGVIYDDVTGTATGFEQGSQAEQYSKILAPEFAFTKMNLREQLKQIGGFIHGEPRVTGIKVDSSGKEYYEVVFDKYGGIKQSTIKDLKEPITEILRTDINDYCTNLDSSVDNLVNALDYAQGVITMPFDNGGVSLRTDTITLRLEENDSSYIPTPKPIYQVNKLLILAYKSGNDYVEVPEENQDITPYLFESADYNNLSSYSGTYPFAKAYALYYTQGEKNIRGLFFKQEDALDTSVFSRFAIVNILRSITGNESITISEYPTITFRIVYKPFYSSRIKTNKSLVIGGLPSSLSYEQGANMIESRYYGENLKGVVARLGNVEKQLTYLLAFISDIPKIGDLYDNNYYISAVSVEYLPTYIKCTIGLSKDFNRLSQYVGINSQKRMWEVSEKMSVDRDTNVQEFVLISKTQQQNDTNSCFNGNGIAKLLIKGSFYQNNEQVYINTPISAVECRRLTKNQNDTQTEWITLPVVASTFGNSMSFAFNFEDNYSAGQGLTYADNQNGISGWFGSFVPYNDYYGRFYWLEAYYEANTTLARGLVSTANALPLSDAVNGTTIFQFSGDTLLRYRKDNREVPQVIYELTAVTDNENIIIGSGLMRNCRLVTNGVVEPICVGFYSRLNSIDSVVNVYYDENNNLVVENGEQINFTMQPNGISAINDTGNVFSSWALIAPGKAKSITVEDDDGVTIQQVIDNVGEIIIGENKELYAGTSSLWFSVKSDVYDKV